jgi:ribonuclease-3
MNNIKNKLVKREFLEGIISKYTGPMKINSIRQFQKAFIHKSFCQVDCDNSDSDNYSSMKLDKYCVSNNERLEFLGDKVIDFIVTEYLFDKFPKEGEGFLTKLKSRIVKKESLSVLGEKLGFAEFMMVSSHVERIRGRDENPRLLEDIFESFVGTLYKDQKCNIKICRKFVLGVIKEFIDIKNLIDNNDNYKDSLLRYFHSKDYNSPVYHVIYSQGNSNSCEFTSVVLAPKEKFGNVSNDLINFQKEILSIVKKEDTDGYLKLTELFKTGVLLGLGKSKKRKGAEQECSKVALINLGVSTNF